MPDFKPDANNMGTLEVGSFIGGTYRVLDFIGQGGMGFVYKVEHLMMAKVLALKVLRSEQVSEEVWKRFRIEAQAIARLDHANVVRIYDMSQTEAGLPYYTMDLLVGQSLADYLDEYYRLPVKEALPIFRQVCAGLAYAHDRGIIHRDIKPGNIMLLSDGRENAAPVVKIVDFGIAKLSSFDNGFGQGLTRPGEVFGSPLYMSPEQCSGQQLDHRTDMYSVGVTMFQALTGRPPLVGKTAIETTAMHQSVVPPSMAEVIDLEEDEEPVVFSPQLEEIVARLLAKSPDARYDSLADVARALLSLERGESRKDNQDSESRKRNGSGNISVLAQMGPRQSSYGRAQVLTSGQSDTDSALVGASQTKIFIMAAAVIALLGVVAMAVYMLSAQKKHEQEQAAHMKILSFDRNTVSQNLSVLHDLNEGSLEASGALSQDKVNLVESYLAAHSGYYSKPATVGGKRVIAFQFPTKFDLGELAYWSPDNLRVKEYKALGAVSLRSDAALHLKPSAAVIAYPELLKGFRPDELVELCFNERKERTEKLFPILQGYTRLRRLELRGSNLASSDVASLDKLRTVTELCLDKSTLSGRELARCKILPNLTTLGATGVKEITPLLKKLAGFGKLEALEVSRVNLTKEDCGYISQLTNLWNLSLKDAPVTDEDIAQFKNLKKLRELDLSRCNNLTLKSIDTLAQMKSLEQIRATEELMQADSATRLRKALPKLRVFDVFM